MTWHLALMTVLLLSPTIARADRALSPDSQVQPYIDSLMKKKNLRPARSEPDLPPVPRAEEPAKSRAYSADPNEVQPYIQKLLNDGRTSGVDKNMPSTAVSTKPGATADSTQPYIEAIKTKNDLQPNFKGTVTQSAGFSIVAANTFNVTSTQNQANGFDQVYNPGNKYAPSADLFYAHQVYRNQYVGAFSLIGHFNIITISGKGIFTQLGTASQTNFKFYSMPVTLGGEYRFLQLRWVQPYLQLGAVGIPFVETRDDGFPSRKGISRGYNFTGGVAINLDWVSRSSAWAQYDDAGILHTYLIAQMEFIRPIAGAVSFDYTGTYVGLMFEF